MAVGELPPAVVVGAAEPVFGRYLIPVEGQVDFVPSSQWLDVAHKCVVLVTYLEKWERKFRFGHFL